MTLKPMCMQASGNDTIIGSANMGKFNGFKRTWNRLSKRSTKPSGKKYISNAKDAIEVKQRRMQQVQRKLQLSINEKPLLDIDEQENTRSEISVISRITGHGGPQCSTIELSGVGPLSSTMDYPQHSTPDRGLSQRRRVVAPPVKDLKMKQPRLDPVGEESMPTPSTQPPPREPELPQSEEVTTIPAASARCPEKPKAETSTVRVCCFTASKRKPKKRESPRMTHYKRELQRKQSYSISVDAGSWMENCTTWDSVELDDFTCSTNDSAKTSPVRNRQAKKKAKVHNILARLSDDLGMRGNDYSRVSGKSDALDDSVFSTPTRIFGSRPPCDGQESSPTSSRHGLSSGYQTDSQASNSDFDSFVRQHNNLNGSQQRVRSRSRCRNYHHRNSKDSSHFGSPSNNWPVLAVF